MARVIGIEIPEVEKLDPEKALSRLLLIQSIRTFSLLAVFLIILFVQIKDPLFINIDVIIPSYLCLFFMFVANSVYIYFFDSFSKKVWAATVFLFVLDTVFVSALIRITGFNQSVFLFMYLVNISLAGFVFQRKGAFFVALLTSIAFSLILITGPEVAEETLLLVVGLNNLAFFAVAGLSGYLSTQMNFMGLQIQTRDREIQSLQDLNQMIVDNISSGLMTVSSEGVVLHANRAAQEILGRKAPLANEKLSELLPDAHRLVSNQEFLRSQKFGRLEVPYAHPGGDSLILGLSISRLISNEDVVQGLILIFQDLTQIKRLEMAVRRSEKLAAVGALAAGIAHEIRNPLASISGSIQLLSANLAASAEDKKLMSIVIKEIDRLNRLITDFLDFVKPDEKLNKVIDVSNLVAEVLELVKLNQKLRKDVKQETHLTSSAIIFGNPDKLKQVFLNLAINAYQAMESTPQPVLSVRVDKGPENIRVVFKDNGPGMSQKVLARLFEPFHTTKTQGTGLGLATVHKIVETHDGQIFVESSEGKGAEFTLEFKVAPKGLENSLENSLDQYIIDTRKTV